MIGDTPVCRPPATHYSVILRGGAGFATRTIDDTPLVRPGWIAIAHALAPGNYSAVVRFSNSAGKSEWSDAGFTRIVAAPPPAATCKIQIVTGNLLVSWVPPYTTSPVIACKVLLRAAGRVVEEMTVAAPTTFFSFLGVTRGVTYTARVQFGSDGGWGVVGPESDPINLSIPFHADPPKLEAVGGSCVRVTWSAPSHRPGVPACSLAKVKVFKTSVDRSMSAVVVSDDQFPATQTFCEVSGLSDGFDYHASVVFANSVGYGPESPSSNSVSFTRNRSVRAPSVECSGANELVVTWSVPTDGLPPSSCHVWVVDVLVPTKRLWDNDAGKLRHGAVFVKPMPASLKKCTLHGLSTGSKYRVAITFQNDIGWSDPSVESSIVWLCPPGASPEKPVFTPLGQDCTQVIWTPPVDVPSVPRITHCWVFMRLVGDNEWDVFDSTSGCLKPSASVIPGSLIDGVMHPSKRCIVSGLVCGGEYEARVCFRNAVGAGPFSLAAKVSLPGKKVQTDCLVPAGGAEAFREEDEDEEEDQFEVNKSIPSGPQQPATEQNGGSAETTPLHVIFVVDSSRSMGVQDVNDTSGRRIDMVLQRVEEFVDMHCSHASAKKDVFSFITFSSVSKVQFSSKVAHDASANLKHMRRASVVEPAGPTDYVKGLDACLSLGTQEDVAVRIVFLSDGRPGDWNRAAVSWFQRSLLPAFKNLELHTVGFGPDENLFEVLQQMAQLGRGSFQVANLCADQLRSAFTSVAASITLTRLRGTGVSAGVGTVADTGLQRRDLDFTAPLKPSEYVWNGQKQKCVRKSFTWDASCSMLKLQGASQTETVRRSHPHTKGNMRYIFAFWDSSFAETNMVAKETLFQRTSEDVELGFVKCSTVAAHYAESFRRLTGIPLNVVECYLYEAQLPTNAPKDRMQFFCAELFVSGVFTKWVGNFGFISACSLSEVPACFAHFTYAASDAKLMVSDIQGVFSNGTFTITDPQVLSEDHSFGRADLGHEGMNRFMENHSCGDLCKHLGLDPASRSRLGQNRWAPPANLKPFSGLSSASAPSTSGQPSSSHQHRGSPDPQQGNGRHPRPGTLLGDRLPASDLVGVTGARPLRLLFVGECTLSFCASAVQVVGSASSLPWTASELVWPMGADAATERQTNEKTCKQRGVEVLPQSVDARALRDVGCLNLDGAIWAMPYPDAYSPQAGKPSMAIVETMRELIHGFVIAAAPSLRLDGGRISVLIMSHQHLMWELRSTIVVQGVGTFVPEMRVFSLTPFLDVGYRPRFGDKRDRLGRKASYHHSGEAVLVQWRRQVTSSDAPAGMTDSRLRRRM